MVTTQNENYMYDLIGPLLQLEPRLAGERLGTPRSSFSEAPMAFGSSAEKLIRKIRENIHQPALVAAPLISLFHS